MGRQLPAVYELRTFSKKWLTVLEGIFRWTKLEPIIRTSF